MAIDQVAEVATVLAVPPAEGLVLVLVADRRVQTSALPVLARPIFAADA